MTRVTTQPFVVVGAIIEKDGKILLVKENQPGRPAHGKWSHPAGWLDMGEDPVEGVKREVKEETGLDFTPTHLLGIYSLLKKEEGSIRHPVKLTFIGKSDWASVSPLSDDVSETRWFSPEEIYRMGKELRDLDIKQMVRDYFSGKRYPLEVLRHTVSK